MIWFQGMSCTVAKWCTYVIAAQFEKHVNVVIVFEKPFKLTHISVAQDSVNLDLCLKLESLQNKLEIEWFYHTYISKGAWIPQFSGRWLLWNTNIWQMLMKCSWYLLLWLRLNKSALCYDLQGVLLIRYQKRPLITFRKSSLEDSLRNEDCNHHLS